MRRTHFKAMFKPAPLGRSLVMALAIALISTCLSAETGEDDPTRPPAGKMGEPLLILGTGLLDGAPRSVRGEGWQLLVFWSAERETCLAALRDLGPALRELMRRGVGLATIELGATENRPLAARWLRRLALPGQSAFAVAPQAMAASIDRRLDLDLAQLPAYRLITPDGTVGWAAQGIVTPARLLALPAADNRPRVLEDLVVRKAWEREETLREFFLDEPGDGSAGSRFVALPALCDSYVERRDHPRAAICLETVGSVFAGRQDEDAGRELFAAAWREYMAADDVFGRWFTLLSLGFLDAKSGSQEGALSLFDRAQAEVEAMRPQAARRGRPGRQGIGPRHAISIFSRSGTSAARWSTGFASDPASAVPARAGRRCRRPPAGRS